MKILIIGCGYVGMALAGLWKEGGQHDLTVTTTREERIPELREVAQRVAVFDSTHPKGLDELLAGQDVVILSVGSKGRDSYQECYLDTARQISEAMNRMDQPPQQLIYTSSTSVYGSRNGEWVTEETPLSPGNAQAQILCDTEQLLLEELPEGCAVCIFRLAGIIGPGREPRDRVKGLAGQELAGNGDNYVNLIQRDDIVQAIDTAVAKRLSGIYNLCGDTRLTRREYYDGLCEELGVAPIRWNSDLPSIHGGNKRVSNEKAKSVGLLSS